MLSPSQQPLQRSLWALACGGVTMYALVLTALWHHVMVVVNCAVLAL